MTYSEPVRFGHVIHVVGRYQKSRSRHIFHNQGRVSRDVLSHMPGQCSGVGIVTTTSRSSDDDSYGFAFVERFLRVGRSICKARIREHYPSHDEHHRHSSHKTSPCSSSCLYCKISFNWFTRLASILKRAATIFSISSPVSGSVSSRDFLASARNSGSLSVSTNALRNISTR